ncbi:hypothetical protein DDE18_21545 [Nocardioides gansuensis]|uniref:Uncharacterized protein n=1 Tax=Nocardioides gansuensis TaxID=2138300 RepID=A0A2T8F4U3_9ACTN|nr:hypothetical protein DDE18_21545 [Nocardioides gansuensis]
MEAIGSDKPPALLALSLLPGYFPPLPDDTAADLPMAPMSRQQDLKGLVGALVRRATDGSPNSEGARRPRASPEPPKLGRRQLELAARWLSPLRPHIS